MNPDAKFPTRISAEKVVAWRKHAGISQYKLAKITGLTNATLSRIENGKQPSPTLSTVLKIAEALNVEITKLLE